ncbi:MAG: mandelate racemase/muconate lactonizing enzyme family protein [Thermoprotei archaeon]|nr:MAG: mandelate racemase/muconate lactonizing enzyme family protein [Thermoprotei archaeon]RLF01792.1 MAG: mandelate racemase/muconate lactonizing enzyme family protein [Thermoprotei archaeon]
MKITDIRTTIVKGNFEWTLVKVYTDENINGLGESYWGAGVVEVIERLKRSLIGENPLNVERLYQKMYRGCIPIGSIAGTVVTAISGIEIALWDILGKKLDCPVYTLLGGEYRRKIKVYADCGSPPDGDPESYVKRVKKVIEMGYKAVKIDINPISSRNARDPYNRRITSNDIEHMVKVVETVREAIGDEIDLAVDCHWQFTPSDAIKLANKLEAYDLMWMEDPIPPENVDALVKVSRKTNIPICTGENLYTRYGFKDIIEKQAVDVVSPDIPRAGGLSECKKIADMADLYYILFAPHNVSTPIGTIASAHVCAAVPNFLVIEFHSVEVPWWSAIVKGYSEVIRDGYIELKDKPGLGLELNREVVEKHLKEGEELFP